MNKAFVAYIMGGPHFIEELKVLDRSGADYVEIGIPFSDPVADGPIIKAAGERAIAAGMTLEVILNQLSAHRHELSTNLILMTYAHMIETYGEAAFMLKMDELQIYGVIIPNMPFEYIEQLKARYPKRKVKLISLVAMTASEDRMKAIAEKAEGFIYTVTMNQTTGQDGNFHPELKQRIQKLKAYTPLPVMAGFGIRDASQVQDIITVSDGVIIGSEIVKRFHETEKDETAAYLQNIRDVLNEATMT
ncbi:tryptophan synthase subunit alpha [Staphylococcus agnetis]|uniref:tryptophan synthase subunit alpha n=1 Tax=Staphylococcus agnetis TaxID=985762 RepID=UPI000D1BF33E|nr:tryptophan synthase subunit alpha [Staphylococcus agnetis]PTH59478.1 tryptophan synthase subunit alpha [Staphylococcus agnetis]